MQTFREYVELRESWKGALAGAISGGAALGSAAYAIGGPVPGIVAGTVGALGGALVGNDVTNPKVLFAMFSSSIRDYCYQLRFLLTKVAQQKRRHKTTLITQGEMEEEARQIIGKLKEVLGLCYDRGMVGKEEIHDFIIKVFECLNDAKSGEFKDTFTAKAIKLIEKAKQRVDKLDDPDGLEELDVEEV